MTHINRSILIQAPMSKVYNQWTQFEDFPQFMPGAVSVHQLNDTHVMWNLRLLGKHIKWHTVISEQCPDEYIAWYSNSRLSHYGRASFLEFNGVRTRVKVELDYQPFCLMGKIAVKLGLLRWHLAATLRGFRRFIERRADATGAWRGVVHLNEVATRDGRRVGVDSVLRGLEKAQDP